MTEDAPSAVERSRESPAGGAFSTSLRAPLVGCFSEEKETAFSRRTEKCGGGACQPPFRSEGPAGTQPSPAEGWVGVTKEMRSPKEVVLPERLLLLSSALARWLRRRVPPFRGSAPRSADWPHKASGAIDRQIPNMPNEGQSP